MDPRFTGEMLKHLEKQNELLSESHSSISHELHKLQVEEEMLMRKFYQLMEAQGQNKKNESIDHSTALVGPICSEVDETGNSTALVCTKSKEQ
ncbi:uncharacterized protein LOC111317063 [Durio zibethinus]|uniref:Uncharacterized protein LOC111317063 n=1 Tax=Durio zibethinus TaxID=66656 RepID=A0A6P6BDG7_DURZI|nr:uncharacterized protein LOC111317063 [Durio zibethinus]XP_022775121.1 uncharacterized protein LOC111317063 [Durio zibethinus]XP_022775122.1 uncharacterized protein LOC111317063 [Durio zibethinus]XP_022775123.1 uncharacterized protein LOC111317063 [Durio zibethinus]